MKQFQFVFQNTDSLHRDLYKITGWQKSHITSCMIFQIYSEQPDKTLIEEICGIIQNAVPDAMYFGCSTNGNILNGRFSESEVIIICTVCEYPETKAEILQYPLSDETIEEVTEDFLKKLEERPWVKFVELEATIRHTSLKPFADKLERAREDILIFGGGAFSENINSNDSCVFSSVGGYSEDGIVLLLVGGSDIHITTTFITGWKPLCKEFHITKAEGNILYEIDGLPAYDVYYKYLNIKNDENFFKSALEFPFFYEHNGIQILRAPLFCDPNGSLYLTSDIDENVSAHIAYGDSATILEIVRGFGNTLLDFHPEAIKVFSCAVRRVFWGTCDISKETEPFQDIAPTSGFYTSGEFMRTNGKMNLHNITLVIAALREGDPVVENKTHDFIMNNEEEYIGRSAMINRLANFINVATNELEETNKKLAFVAVTDGLTKLFNRTEIQRRIKERLSSGKTLSLVMMDLDNFKKVNDTFGHSEGDIAITGLSELLHDIVSEFGEYTDAGRWGGEEFMLMLPFHADEAARIAERIRTQFSELCFPAAKNQTVSLGVTEAIAGEALDSLLIRVDKALYSAKNNGKNQYVIM